MANSIMDLVVKLTLDDSELESGLKGAKDRVTSGMSKAANVAAGAVLGLGAAAVKTTADFDAEMSKVSAISGATGDDFDQLRAKAREMGAQTKFSATESGQAFEYMAMAGWKTEQMLSGIEGVMNLAAASGEDLATTSDIVTDAMTAFGLGAEQSTHFADILAAASSNANTNVSMMGETFKYVAPVAGSMGYTAEDTAVAIGLMANSGIKASQAGTTLRSIMTRLASPTDDVASAMQVLGIELEDGHGNMRSFRDVLDQLRNSFQGGTLTVEEYNQKLEEIQKQADAGELSIGTYDQALMDLNDALENGTISTEDYMKAEEDLNRQLAIGSLQKGDYQTAMDDLAASMWGAEGAQKAQLASTIAGKNALAGFLAIVESSDSDVDFLTEAIDNCDGSSKRMADTMQDNLNGQITILKSQLQELAISFGDMLMPEIRKLVSHLQEFIDKLNSMSEDERQAIINTGKLVLVLAGVTKAIIGFGKLARAVKDISILMNGLKTAAKGAEVAVSGISKAGPALSGAGSAVSGAVSSAGAFMTADVGATVAAGGAAAGATIGTALVGGAVAAIGGAEAGKKIGAALFPDDKELYDEYSGIEGTFKMLGDTFKTFGERTAEHAQNAWDKIKKVTSGKSDFLWNTKEGLTGMAEDLEYNYDRMGGDTEEFRNEMMKYLHFEYDLDISQASKAIDTFVEEAKSGATNMEDVGAKMGKSMDLDTFTEKMAKGVASVKDFFANLGEAIANSEAVNKMTEFKDKISEGFNSVVEKFQNDLTTIKDFFVSTWTAISDFFAPIVDAIKYTAGAAIEWIQWKFQNDLTALKDIFVSIWTAISDFVGPIVDGIKEKISAAWQTVSEITSTVLEAIKAKFEADWNRIKEIIDVVHEGIKSAIQVAYDFIEEHIFSKMLAIQEKMAEVWENIKNGMTEKIQSAVDTVKELFNGLGEFFGGLAKKAAKWGSDMMDGFKQGIKDGRDKIATGIRGVGDKIKANMGHSHPTEGPLADDYKWMPDMMQLFAQGISENGEDVVGAMTDLTGDMSDAMDLSTPAFEFAGGYGTMSANEVSGGSEDYGDIITAITDALMNMQLMVNIGNRPIEAMITDAQQRTTYRSGGR